MIAYSVFLTVYNTVKPIPWIKEWCNINSYLPGAVEGPIAPKLEEGEMVSSISNKGRRCIIVGTKFGNIVVFERRVAAPNPSLCVSCVDMLKCKPSYNISFDSVVDYIGDGIENGKPNLGIRLKNQYSMNQ